MKRDKNKIYVSGPSITEKEEMYVLEAVKNAWYDDANIYNERFETILKEYIGRKYAISLPSCTSAIHLTLEALGIGYDDEVIIPDITWIATAAPIKYVGATPVFAEIDEMSWCLDGNKLEQYITPKTKAIITVDLYGNMPDYAQILDIAERYKIPVIEDSAEALGSSFREKKAGGFGVVSVFSFHGSKMLTTGEGGMLLTDNVQIYERCIKMRDHGRNTSLGKMFWNDEIGYKYKMSSMQAALGIAQMERIDELIERKTKIFISYYEKLKGIDGIRLNEIPQENKSNYWMITIVWKSDIYNLTKEELMEYFKKNNIDTRPIFYPLSDLPPFENSNKIKNPIAEEISRYGINLPSDINISECEIDKVCSLLKRILNDRKKN